MTKCGAAGLCKQRSYLLTNTSILPCISVWHDHLSVLIISLPLLMQRDFGYHWYCGGAVPPRDPDSHVQMKVFICEHKYSFFPAKTAGC